MRLIPIKSHNTGGVTGWCLDIHDLIAGKYLSARDKDLEFALTAIKQGLVKEHILRERIEILNTDACQKEVILNRLTGDFRTSPDTTF
jgi:hypothetical protein